MKNNNLKYFLAANSCEGFISRFKDSYDASEGWDAFLIKGGPGTGKSSFMKKIAEAANQKGQKIILCPCSSDPDSLDAVILPETKTVIMDATAPHIIEPTYPAVCEEILNFGEFWEREKLKVNAKEIIYLTNQNKRLHKTASNYLSAAGKILDENLETVARCTNKEKAEKFAQNLCKRYIPKQNRKGKYCERFISGITPKGVINFTDTPTQEASNLVIINDKYGITSNIIIDSMLKYAVNNGYYVIPLKNAFLPSKLTDGIIIPELSLCIIRENNDFKISSNVRRIHYKRFTDINSLKKYKSHLKFNNKVYLDLLKSAIETLKKAKSVHDVLEKNYINAMNFKKIETSREELIKKIIK